MAKYDTDEIGKPGKPPRVRRFPWRLWLFAVAMTAGAVAGGYYTWQYRGDARVAADERDVCRVAAAKQKPALDEANKKATDCEIRSGSYAQKAKDLETKLAALVPGAAVPATPPGATPAPPAAAPTTPPATQPAPVVVAPPAAAAPGKWLAPIEEIQKQLARMSETGQLRMGARRGSFVLTLPAEAMFATGAAELSKPGELAVVEVGLTLKRYPDRRFLVTAHTDEAPAKTTTYKDSWELSLARGLAVTRVLLQTGVEARNLIAAGAGDGDPVAKDTKHQRIEIALLPSASELSPLPASLGPDSVKPDFKVEAPLPATRPDAAKPAKP